MPRVKRGFTRHRRHAAVLQQVQGHRTTRGHLFRTANQELMKSLMYAYRDRRTRKRDMRSLWITRINAAARMNGMPYNRFIAGLNTLGITIDRKMLSELAVNDPHGFAVLASQIKGEPAPAYVAPVVVVAPQRRQRNTETSATTSVAPATTTATTTVAPVSLPAVSADETTAPGGVAVLVAPDAVAAGRGVNVEIAPEVINSAEATTVTVGPDGADATGGATATVTPATEAGDDTTIVVAPTAQSETES